MLNVVSGVWISDSSELLLDWPSEDFELEEAPNIAFKMFHLFLGGGGSEDEDSETEELLLFFLVDTAAGSDGAGGTTRSKETNKLAGGI